MRIVVFFSEVYWSVSFHLMMRLVDETIDDVNRFEISVGRLKPDDQEKPADHNELNDTFSDFAA